MRRPHRAVHTVPSTPVLLAASSSPPRPAAAEPPIASWLGLRDDALAAELRERLAHDTRTAHLALDVLVAGGVTRT